MPIFQHPTHASQEPHTKDAVVHLPHILLERGLSPSPWHSISGHWTPRNLCSSQQSRNVKVTSVQTKSEPSEKKRLRAECTFQTAESAKVPATLWLIIRLNTLSLNYVCCVSQNTKWSMALSTKVVILCLASMLPAIKAGHEDHH